MSLPIPEVTHAMGTPPTWLVVMGVSGCGKSTLGRALASETGLPFIEGDEFHSQESIAKMRSGMPLSDEDRNSWLDRLASQLRSHENGAILSCSALKKVYRARLSAVVDNLKFVYLQIDAADARSRVAERREHIFPTSLVDSQFAVLEAPRPGPDVLELRAMQPTPSLCQRTLRWMRQSAEEQQSY